jgi:AbrB family looped-hinge helix DNA binding protein
MSVATISAKGWVVIPAEYRHKYGLEPGDKVSIVDYGGVLSIMPVPRDPIEHACGLLAGGPSLTRALLKERREERRREDRKCARFRSR